MRIKLLTCLLVFLLALPLTAAPPKGKSAPRQSAAVDNTTFINVNKILMFVTNHGNFGRDLSDRFGYDYGTFYPYTSVEAIEDGSNTTSPNYASGLWIGATDQATGDTLIVVSEYDSEYVPGPMTGGTFSPDQPYYRVFKLFKDSLGANANQDLLDYIQYAVPDGAPPMTINDSVLPYGDQMCWAVYNDADPAQHANDAGETDPLGIEVRQTTFAYEREDPLGEVIFVILRVYNNGSRTLENCFFSLWCDPDLGLAGDDFVGCDTTLDLGFVYNADNDDQQYGKTPPALGMDFFQGPLVTGTAADTGRMWGQLYPGMRNLGMGSFNKYINGTDPHSYVETYQYMNGLNGNQAGAPYVTPAGDTTVYFHAGNPVTGVGDLDFNPADRRWMQTTGPVTFAPGDSTEILFSFVVGQGGDRLSSISVMKYNDQFAQSAYDNYFDIKQPPATPEVTVGKFDGEIALQWGNVSETSPGTYPFQGYTVYQGTSASGPWTFVANFDIIDGVAQILDNVVDPLTGALEYRLVKRGSDGGLQRYFVVDQDYINGGDLFNYTPYYFRVEAYSFDPDPDALPRTLTSARSGIVVTPQPPTAGTELPNVIGDTLAWTHPSGPSGGSITVTVVDPSRLTGDEYQVFFVDTVGIVVDTIVDVGTGDTTFESTDIAWFLQNTTTGDTLLAWQTNQAGDLDYQVVDGMLVQVSGPASGFSGFYVTANANGPITPPEGGAFDFGGFPSARPTAAQQVGDGLWGIHTADDGGSSGGGTRGSYDAFLSRATRDGGNNATIGIYDYEIRFTGDPANPGVNGSYAIEWFNDDNVYWVPFELWRTGAATPNDPSDDVRLIPFIIDDGDDNTFNLESWGSPLGSFGGDAEHSVSGLDNDPYTDWVYLYEPFDMTPGEAGYDAAEAEMLAGTFPANVATLVGNEVLARVVLVNWNGHTADGDTLTNPPVYTQDLPEQGTIFRMETFKPNTSADIFAFSTTAAAQMAGKESMLEDIKAVPNPYYLFGPYDPVVGNTNIKFTHLPDECTITIYNLGGDYIARVDKDDPTTSEATWNVQTREGLPVASGIYIYVVDAPGFGQKIGKMAVFTEAQVLDIY